MAAPLPAGKTAPNGGVLHSSALGILAAVALGFTIYLASSLLIPVVLGIYLSLIFRPAVRWLERFRIPSGLSAGLILLGLIGTVVAAVVVLGPPAADWLSRLPEFMRDLEARLWPVRQTIEQAQQATAELERVATVDEARPVATVQGPTLLSQAVNFTWTLLAQFAITIILMFFLLAEGSAMITRWILRFGSWSHAAQTVRSIDQIEQQIGRYLFTLVVINAAVGAIMAAICFAVGLPNPIMWGVVAGVLGLVPFLGPLVTLVLLGLAGFLTFDVWWLAAAPAAAYAVLNYMEGEVVTPMIMGRTLQLSPALIFISILFWTWMWGPIGALLAVPILLAGRIILDVVRPPENPAESGRPAAAATTTSNAAAASR